MTSANGSQMEFRHITLNRMRDSYAPHARAKNHPNPNLVFSSISPSPLASPIPTHDCAPLAPAPASSSPPSLPPAAQSQALALSSGLHINLSPSPSFDPFHCPPMASAPPLAAAGDSIARAPSPQPRNAQIGAAPPFLKPPVFTLEGFPPLASSGAAEESPAVDKIAPPKPLSFAAALTRDKHMSRFPDVPLPARQYGTKDGVPSIAFSPSEHQALTQRICHTVIAKFQGSRPPLSAIKAHVESNWKIKGSITISPNWDGRHVVFMMDSEEDVKTALVCPSRKVQLSFFRLFRWSPDYNPKKESTRVNKWLRLPGLPMEFFTRSCVKAIVSSFAHFLDIDDRTNKMNSLQCARACVELDVTGKIPSRVWISVGEQSFFQDVVVEGGIAYCSKCKKHGHDVTTCKKMAKPKVDEPMVPDDVSGRDDPVGHVSLEKEISHPLAEETCSQTVVADRHDMSKALVIYKYPTVVDPVTTISTDLTGDPATHVAESGSVSPPISEWTKKKRKNKGKNPGSKSGLLTTCSDPQAISTDGPNCLGLRQSSRSKKSSENSDFVYHANGKKSGIGKARKKVSFHEIAEVMCWEEEE